MAKNLIDRDMLQKPMYEVEHMIKSKNDMTVNQFATISGIKGKQFGREIFSCILKFKDLMDFLEVFPEVQRDIVPRRVSRIKNYVLTGVEDRTNMRFFSGLTVTARGNIFYDENTHKLAIDTNNSKLSINDGQHRFYGISEAIRELQGRYNKAKDKATQDKAGELLEELKQMVVPIVIFNNISEKEEKQLFHDLNNLAQRPSRSATIKLAQTDIYSVIARELSSENEYLKRYGVEYNKMSIHKKNPNTILLTTVYAMIKNLYWSNYIQDFNFLNEENYTTYKQKTNETFNSIFKALPQDLYVKDKYVISKNYALKGIAKFVHHCRENLKLEDDKIFEAIRKVNWESDLNYWSTYGAFPSQSGIVQFSGNGEGGITAIFTACVDNLDK